MKFKILRIAVALMLVPLQYHQLLAQPSKSAIVVRGILTHYDRTGKFYDRMGFYKYPIDPGLELLYQYKLCSSFFISTGLGYQYGRLANWNGAQERFRFSEISIPIEGKLIFTHSAKTNFFMVAGSSFGKISQVKWESPSSGNDWIVIDKNYDERYSSDESFVDFLLGLGISVSVSHQNEFSITPYLKYRTSENWMNYARDNIHYGIKVSYQLNLKRNEKM